MSQNMRGNILIDLGMRKISWGISNFVIIKTCQRIPLIILKKRVVNFDIIECCGDPLQGTYKGYKTITDKNIKEYPKPVMGGIFRNFDRKNYGSKKSSFESF